MKLIKSKLDKAAETLAASIKSGEDISAEDIQPVVEQLSAVGIDGFMIVPEEGYNELEGNVETLTSENADLKKQLAESKAEVTRLSGLAGAAHTDPDKKQDAAHGGEENAKSEKMDEELPHNAEAIEELNKIG